MLTSILGCAGVAGPPVTTALPTLSVSETVVGTGVPSLTDLRAILYRDDERARLDAIAKLRADGSADAVTILAEFFMNSDLPGRLEAGQALLSIDNPQVRSYFRAALSDKQLTSRRHAANEALEQQGDQSLPFLQMLMHDDNVIIRLNVIDVAQFIGTPGSKSLLSGALGDSSPEVRQAAIGALEGLGDLPTPQKTVK